MTGRQFDDETHALVRAVAAHGLDGTSAPISHPLDAGAWERLVHAVRSERLVGLLDVALAAGTLPATDEQRSAAENYAVQAARRALELEGTTVDAVQALRARGIDALVLKGAAIAHLDEATPERRNFADIDLLVRGEQMADAQRVLADLGYARDLPPRAPWFDRRYGKEASLRRPDGTEVDLHRSLALGAFGLAIDVDQLWHRTQPFRVGDSALEALDHEARFVHACVNAAVGDARPRLVAVRDIAVIATRHALDATRITSLLRPRRGLALVAEGVRLCDAVLGVRVGGEAGDLARDVRPSRWEQLALRTYRSHGGSNTLELLGGALALTGAADRVQYLRALVRPSPEYRAARRRAGRTNEWRAAIRELIGRRLP